MDGQQIEPLLYLKATHEPMAHVYSQLKTLVATASPNGHTVNVLKFQTLLVLFSNKMLVIRAGIHTMLDRIANRKDPDQTASSEAV